MSRQLDILALEPYFGGIRRNMLETLGRCSRHRWTLLTLPPRRMERRLAAAAHWFAEQIARRGVGPIDILFTCDALNLADLYRLCPAVADRPSVVYFHSNQLPDLSQSDHNHSLDLTNLTTATAATEIWFNSRYHAETFLNGVEGLVKFHPELRSRDPVRDLQKKLMHVPPPVDMGLAAEIGRQLPTEQDPSAIFVDTHEGDVDLLNAALEILYDLQNEIHLIVTGPVDRLSNRFPRQVIAENDRTGQMRGLLSAGAFVSIKMSPPFDENAVRALSLHRRPVLPAIGIYRDLIPRAIQSMCLYDLTAEGLASSICQALFRPVRYRISDLSSQLQCFEAIAACNVIDDRLDQIASRGLSPATAHSQKTDPRKHLRPVPKARS